MPPKYIYFNSLTHKNHPPRCLFFPLMWSLLLALSFALYTPLCRTYIHIFIYICFFDPLNKNMNSQQTTTTPQNWTRKTKTRIKIEKQKIAKPHLVSFHIRRQRKIHYLNLRNAKEELWNASFPSWKKSSR